MIRSVRGAATRAFIEGGRSRFSGMDEKIARRRIAQLSAATSLDAFGRLNSVGLHKLKGDLRDYWAVTINGPWRLLFKFHDGDAYDVHIRDYH